MLSLTATVCSLRDVSGVSMRLPFAVIALRNDVTALSSPNDAL